MIRGSGIRELIDQSVKKVVDTQRMLERYKSFSTADSRNEAKYKRLADNFGRASRKLEESMRKFSERSTSPEGCDSTQMRVMTEAPRSFPKIPSSSSSFQPPSGYEYISSMEEGMRGQTLQDLKRINGDMSSLQDIYFSLSEVASGQQSVIDSVQSKLSQVGHSATSAVHELNKAKDRMDYWTRLKVYTVTGVAAVGLFFWII